MNVAQIIIAKRDGMELSRQQLGQLVNGYIDGTVPDYQMAAFAMAVFFQGMSFDETAAMTEVMLKSGDILVWPKSNRPKVDKHSTGGLGDKVSIVLAPLLACCGVDVPMISGRALGITGGTLDKLESIPGFNCELTSQQVQRLVQQVGCGIVGASSTIVPADQKLYSLRDVTGTVPSVPLITSSILSKKLAEGLDSLVLDIKCGNGAFMKTLSQAKELAASLVAVGNKLGVRTSALITDMNQPLGEMIGNSVEIEESLAVLGGEGPADVRELTMALATELLVACGMFDQPSQARVAVGHAIDTKRALEKFSEMVAAQGGRLADMARPTTAHEIRAAASGHVSCIDCQALGLAVIEMGGGREELGDNIDHSVGIQSLARIGDRVDNGHVMARVFCDRPSESVVHAVSRAYKLSERDTSGVDLIVERIEVGKEG